MEGNKSFIISRNCALSPFYLAYFPVAMGLTLDFGASGSIRPESSLYDNRIPSAYHDAG
ncbi:8533_t:CDS:2 [Entrophospora sp. SA101]|nr:8533_t:CDS:2 [Entrophospora sp. SA101]